MSMDGDTFYKPGYLEAVCDSLGAHPRATALSAPFYHPLGPVEEQNRALLRYELYMRHYFLNLLRIDSPYAFLALGSTISLPVWAYRKVGGISPFKAGEDFYFLQKLGQGGKGSQRLRKRGVSRCPSLGPGGFRNRPGHPQGGVRFLGLLPVLSGEMLRAPQGRLRPVPPPVRRPSGHAPGPFPGGSLWHSGSLDAPPEKFPDPFPLCPGLSRADRRPEDSPIPGLLSKKRPPYPVGRGNPDGIRDPPSAGMPFERTGFRQNPRGRSGCPAQRLFFTGAGGQGRAGAKGRVLQRPGSLPRPGRYSWPDGPRG